MNIFIFPIRETLSILYTKMQRDFTKGKIYKIISELGECCYIGSTTSPLCQRMAVHRYKYREHVNGRPPGYCSSFEVLKYADVRIELLELFPCTDDKELREHERMFKEREPTAVNKYRAIQTAEERHQQLRAASARYRAAHRDEINARQRAAYAEKKAQRAIAVN